MINAKKKKKWVAALRSGKYTQGFGRLKSKHKDSSKNCFCVLGVAENIGIAKRKSYSHLEDSFLSDELQRKIGILNDCDRMSFKWLASYIERYL